MRRSLVIPLVVLSVVAVSCSKDKTPTTTPTSATPTVAAAATFSVDLDVKGDPDTNGNATIYQYFPNAVTAHAGDKIDFHNQSVGEPHSVSSGTLVETALADIAKLPKGSEDQPASAKVLPNMLPDGQPDTDASGADPCYLATGVPVKNKACAKVDQPEFDGKHAYYSSGWLALDSTYSVTLAENLAPGKYTFYCNLHGPDMHTTVTVVAKDAKADTPDEVIARAKTERDTILAKLTPLLSGVTNVLGGATAGLFPTSQDVPGQLNIFPKEIAISVGGSVTWVVQGPHAIAFNAPQDAKTIRFEAPDGSIHINPKAAAPAGGAGAPQAPPQFSAPGPAKVYDGGRWDGTGFRSSGIFISFPPRFQAFKLRFTKAGTYTYICTVHDNMEGTVKVG